MRILQRFHLGLRRLKGLVGGVPLLRRGLLVVVQVLDRLQRHLEVELCNLEQILALRLGPERVVAGRVGLDEDGGGVGAAHRGGQEGVVGLDDAVGAGGADEGDEGEEGSQHGGVGLADGLFLLQCDADGTMN